MEIDPVDFYLTAPMESMRAKIATLTAQRDKLVKALEACLVHIDDDSEPEDDWECQRLAREALAALQTKEGV